MMKSFKTKSMKPKSMRFSHFSPFLILFLFVSPAPAQDLDQIKLRFDHVNDLRTGYDSSDHTYKETRINELIVNPTNRPVTASVCESFTASTPEAIHKNNPGKPCGNPQVERLAPEGVDTFVWELKGPDPITKKTTVLRRRVEQVHSVPPPANPACVSLELESTKVATQACWVKFAVPTQKFTSAPPRYSIDLTILDKDKKPMAKRTE